MGSYVVLCQSLAPAVMTPHWLLGEHGYPTAHPQYKDSERTEDCESLSSEAGS